MFCFFMSHEGSFSLDSDAEPVNRRLASFVCIFFEFVVDFQHCLVFTHYTGSISQAHFSPTKKFALVQVCCSLFWLQLEMLNLFAGCLAVRYFCSCTLQSLSLVAAGLHSKNYLRYSELSSTEKGNLQVREFS
jgi:hypothetical protein